LLIACADVANVQFARLSGRANEFAVRAAGRQPLADLAVQLLTESILLSLGGAALGLLITQWALALILSHMPPDVARFIAGWKTIRLDTNAFLFTLGIAWPAALLPELLPRCLLALQRQRIL